MTNVTYCITEDNIELGNSRRKSYGISVYVDHKENESAIEIASINNITLDRPKLLEFVRLCNDESLSIIHLLDAIEDFLAE